MEEGRGARRNGEQVERGKRCELEVVSRLSSQRRQTSVSHMFITQGLRMSNMNQIRCFMVRARGIVRPCTLWGSPVAGEEAFLACVDLVSCSS